jgi:cyclopropane fatty-acyl-phospholipid synthase-like methyltransferase
MPVTSDAQYSYMFEGDYKQSLLGRVATARWNRNPETLLFSLSRYKFVAKLLNGRQKVLEIGCGDGWASRIVAQRVGSLVLTDYDPLFVDEALNQIKQYRYKGHQNVRCHVHNFIDDVYREEVDGVFALDVLEHIEPDSEDTFIRNIALSIRKGGLCIFGTPTVRSQELIQDLDRDPGHINCKDEASMRFTLEKHFGGVQVFSMNDELVHTGCTDMAYYVIGIGVRLG